ncbi:MAG TPA: hypothetical protein ENL42_04590 [Thermoplasmatales archaeon]|nr:hypothetical protein [Thermoplasmatales archaeon]
MIDNITITILILLSFLLVWIGIMIFTTKPEEEEIEEAEAEAKAEKTDEKGVVEMEQNEIEKYKRIVAELEEKLRRMEEKPTNDKLLDWLTELRRENEFLRMKISHLEGAMSIYGEESLRVENEKLRREIEDYKRRVEALENEVRELKSSLNYYRDLVSKLQGSYTVLNKYNYRICIRNPETGEYEYQLVKLPPDFDPFNPTYITRDGMEVYEEYGIRIPTKLGDIIREEFKKDIYWQDFELDR